MPAELVALIRRLLRLGHVIELRKVHHASYHAVVRNDLGQRVGDIEYRSLLDEPCVYAQGLSYASVFDAERQPDRAFKEAQRSIA